MIKWITEIFVKTVGLFIKGPGPILPLMLPNQTKVIELRIFPYSQVLGRMIRNLPDPKEGLKITLVSQEFYGDVIARGGSWHLAKGFRFKVNRTWTNK
jgi:hypothetical protein